jgi:hypothetical protein
MTPWMMATQVYTVTGKHSETQENVDKLFMCLVRFESGFPVFELPKTGKPQRLAPKFLSECEKRHQQGNSFTCLRHHGMTRVRGVAVNILNKQS